MARKKAGKAAAAAAKQAAEEEEAWQKAEVAAGTALAEKAEAADDGGKEGGKEGPACPARPCPSAAHCGVAPQAGVLRWRLCARGQALECRMDARRVARTGVCARVMPVQLLAVGSHGGTAHGDAVLCASLPAG
jgi:hypothetical protein